ncbi:biotin carboxylase N-terminal domain-containing protein [Sorangium sp. So ce327]|uniref:acetyl-CoA carboxylase biotin carboxylase subunit n=1 Tax=Sorangium sp. So ce327 TaxID=3133301 RepID=UPI003F5DF388
MLKKILVANRGEIACRVLRTCKRLGIATVAVYSDADASAPHVAMADEAVRIGPPPVRDSYLVIHAIVEAARATGADGIHPGYGLLSENQAFAEAVVEAGVTFIGPPPAVLHAFGDKILARDHARGAGVFPPPGTGGPVDPADVEAAQRAAESIGFPLLVKAAGGGGGIGMQVVTDPGKLSRALTACSDRGRAAFGDPRVYMERYIERPRHIEVQVLCDGQGGAVALGERECSAQRRHQKIVEETPSPAAFFQGAAGELRRKELHDSALRVVTAAGYVGAGTVEFVAAESGELFFLEVNARLQVEHCVTEMCTGLDLVEHQIRIASGEPLAPEVRGHTCRGHAVEARLYAEDPAKKFAPQPGRITALRWPAAGDDLRIETGVAEGLEVTPFYDPLLAKIVAHGPTRDEAIARLDRALAETTIELTGPAGPAATNLAFLRQILQDGDFRGGQYDTRFAEALAAGKKVG